MWRRSKFREMLENERSPIIISSTENEICVYLFLFKIKKKNEYMKTNTNISSILNQKINFYRIIISVESKLVFEKYILMIYPRNG